MKSPLYLTFPIRSGVAPGVGSGRRALVFGQAISGDLVGTIQDASGAGIPGASVSVVNDATNIRTMATANDAGEYRISNLPAGAYTMTATGTRFGTATLKGVKVSLKQPPLRI